MVGISTDIKSDRINKLSKKNGINTSLMKNKTLF